MGALNTLTEARDASYGYLSCSSKKVARAGAGCWSPVAIDADVEAWKKRWSTDTRFASSASGAPKNGFSDVDTQLYWPKATEDMLFKAGTMSSADGDVPPSATRCPPPRLTSRTRPPRGPRPQAAEPRPARRGRRLRRFRITPGRARTP